MDTTNSLDHTKWECKYHIVCTKISKAGDIQRYQSGYRSDIGIVMPQKGSRDYRSRMLSGTYSYAGEDTAQIFGIRNCRIPERKKFPYDI